MSYLQRWQIAGMNQNYKKHTFDYFIESMQLAGFETVELWLGAPHFWLDSKKFLDCSNAKEKCRRAGLKIVSTTTPSGGAFQYQYAAQEPFHHRRSLEYFKNGVRFSAELGARIMTVNSGWGYWDDDYETAFRRSCDMLGEVAETAEKEGIVLALESLTPEESLVGYTVDQIERIIRTVNHPALKAMIDSGAIGYVRESPQQWFDTFGKDMIHYHFQDGDRRISTPGHYAWGKGEFPLEEEIACMERNDYHGYLTQEICGSADPRADDILTMKTLSRFF